MESVPAEDAEYGFLELASYILPYVRLHAKRFIATVILRASGEAASLFPAYALGEMTTFFTTYKTGQPIDYLVWLLILWLATSLYRTLSGRTSTLLGYRVAESIGLDAKIAAMRHVFSLDLSWHETDYAGSKMERVMNGGQGITNIIRMFFTDLIGAFVSIVGAAAIMFSMKVELSAGLLVFAISYYLLSFFLRRKQSLQLRIVQKAREKAGGVNFESIANIHLIKVMDLSKLVLKRIISANTAVSEEVLKLQRQFRVREMITTTYAVVLKFLILLYIGYSIYAGRLEVGIFVMFYVYFDNVLNATAGMSRVADQITEEKEAVSRLAGLMDEKPTVEVSGKKIMPEDWRMITVKNLSFSYPKRSATLNNVSLTVKRGEKVGIVGPTGAGKSTLFKLMLKLDENYSGDILVDETPLREIDRPSYIKRIAVVPQETEVFNATLRENVEITGGHEHNLDKALEMTNLTELIQRLPSGVETIIGEKGVRLSGGEKQRLSIARAFYKNPQLLFLDEPTSQLDANSELKIQDSLRKVFKDVTAIVIAHRISTIQEMDKIIVMEGGKIVEEGTFQQLIGQKGLFNELWSNQKL
ncbi:MAG: ABC transporter ATP-binding protein [Candidatus Altiarchaeota archaeon]|nr:ABC transporter ATP-binding protein [Candidatus Altiarchaeota archaeon]